MDKYFFPITKCTSIVIWNDPNTLGSGLDLPRFTKFLRDSIFLTTFHLDVVVGLLLSNARLSKQVKKGQARLAFKQSMSHFSVFWSIFMILSPYCSVLSYTDNATI